MSVFALERPRVAAFVMGHSGVGKSTLASTFPKPMVVFGFDPAGKEGPYLDRGIPGDIEQGQYCYYRNVYSKNDASKVIIRYEHWSENNPFKPGAYTRFVARTASLEKELVDGGIATVVFDTTTYFIESAIWSSMYGENASVKDLRLHYQFATLAGRQFIMGRMPNLLMSNVVVLAHVDEQKDESDGEEQGVVVRKMAALPGKLPNSVPGGYAEVWYMYMGSDGGRYLQTQRRPVKPFDCKSGLHFKDPTPAHYEALWEHRVTKDGQ